jgi:hypothetical protein
MKKVGLFFVLAAFAATGTPAEYQPPNLPGVSPEVQRRERRLLQELSPARLQMIHQATALFEGQPESVAGPESALDRIFSVAGLGGMDVSEAAFMVLSMATRDMDDDLRTIMAEIKAMNQAKQKLRDSIKELDNSIAGEMGIGNMETRRMGGAASGSGQLPVARMTTHFKIEYWKAPLLEIKNWRGLPLQERRAEAEILRVRLDALEGLLAKMSEQVRRGTERRRRFTLSLEDLNRKLPPPH